MIPLATVLYPAAIGFVIGAISGSFIAAAIYRLPRQLSMLHPVRSFCPACQQNIYWYDNIPLISFLFLRGKCRFCQVRIDRIYPVVELLAVVGSSAMIYYFNDLQTVAWYLILFYLLLAVGFIDARFYIIPNKVLLSGLIPVIIFALLQGPYFFLRQVISGLVALLLLYLVRVWGNHTLKRESLGWGDIKLGAVLAFFLGFQGFLATLFIAACLALLWIGIVGFINSSSTSRQIPLAPFWSVSVVILFFFSAQSDALPFALPFLSKF